MSESIYTPAIGHIYGLLVLPYLISQIYFSEKEIARQERIPELSESNLPGVSIIMPFYNESKEELFATIDSVMAMDYPNMELLVVDDGSKDTSVYESAVARYAARDNIAIMRKEHGGKRKAHQYALSFTKEDSEWILTIDSDTVFDTQCLKKLVETADHLGSDAICGFIEAKKQKGILNRLLRVRYYCAASVERAAQSYWDYMTCMSGPCAMWRAEEFRRLMPEYVSQKFMGKEATFGDDRHMTNLFLRDDLQVNIALNAKCQTSTPEKFTTYIRQQDRWNKSFLRENIWYAKNVKTAPWYINYLVIVGALLPLMLIVNIALATIWHGAIWLLVMYAFYITLFSFIRGAACFWRTWDPNFWLSPIYGFFYMIVLLPLRQVSLFTLWNTRWGTR